MESKHHRINTIIANEIGKKWKDFARALNIKEGKIDELELNHSELYERVIAVLNIHRSQFVVSSNRALESAVLNGLTSARRNDLRKKVEHILDNLE